MCGSYLGRHHPQKLGTVTHQLAGWLQVGHMVSQVGRGRSQVYCLYNFSRALIGGAGALCAKIADPRPQAGNRRGGLAI